MHCNVVGGEKRESAENLNISPSEICANSSQIRNDSACNASGEDKFTSQDKEYLLLLEEIQNSSICQKKMLGSHTFVYPKLTYLIL